MKTNPLEVFVDQIAAFKQHFSGDESDWQLIYDYLLMPIFNIDSVAQLQLPQSQQDRLYYLLETHASQFSQMLSAIGYDLFFDQVLAFQEGTSTYRSRYRPHVIADDTKQAKTTAKLMEYLTRLFCPVEGKSLPCYNLVALIATFGQTNWEIPLAMVLWLPKDHPQYQSKGQLITQRVVDLHKEAQKRGISLSGVVFSCDAAYSRVNLLLQAVIAAGMTLITKMSGNLKLIVQNKSQKAKAIKEGISFSQLKQCSRLGSAYRYRRLPARHPVLGEVLLIVSARYNERTKKWDRILLMTNDLQMQGPGGIRMYQRRWRIEIFFKSLKQHLRLSKFQFRRLLAIQSHFFLRTLGYLLLNRLKREGFGCQAKWTLKQISLWLNEQLIVHRSLKAA